MPSPSATRSSIDRKMRNEYMSKPLNFHELSTKFMRPIHTDAEVTPTGTYNEDITRRLGLSDLHWSLSGTNAAGSLTTFTAGGGLNLNTAGGSGDQMLVQPRDTLDANVCGPWGHLGLSGSVDFDYEAKVGFGASVASIRAGFGLQTAVNPTYTAINDQAIFHFDDDDTTRWQFIASTAGTDTVQTAAPHAAIPTIAVNQEWLFQIRVRNAIPTFFINGVVLGTAPALGATAIKPVFYLLADAAALKTLRLYHLRINRPFA